MNVHITIDTEVWCSSWDNLDEDFPAAYDAFVFGRFGAGTFGIPRLLDVFRRHALRATFFVEPLFSLRFGAEHLERIVDLVAGADQEIQLHLHQEWADETRPPLLQGDKRRRLTQCSLDEQRHLLDLGLEALCRAGADRPVAFRSGGFSCNRDTLRALRDNGLCLDSSYNPGFVGSGDGFPAWSPGTQSAVIDGVVELPITRFTDGLRRLRHAQVGACSFEELRDAMCDARAKGWEHFVILLHNAELMNQRRNGPDPIVVHRFERLCAWLDDNREGFPTARFAPPSCPDSGERQAIGVSAAATARRLAEQAARRMWR
jgi:peptidoglycan/xylan/chitin deacetylase (PgdA/CDA1 family)